MYNSTHVLNEPAQELHRIFDFTLRGYSPKLKYQTYNFHLESLTV